MGVAVADLQGYRSFWNHTVQPESGLLVNYYGLPSISMRDVWFHHWARNEPGFLSRDIMCSINHPNYLGHLCACTNSTTSLLQCLPCSCAVCKSLLTFLFYMGHLCAWPPAKTRVCFVSAATCRHHATTVPPARPLYESEAERPALMTLSLRQGM